MRFLKPAGISSQMKLLPDLTLIAAIILLALQNFARLYDFEPFRGSFLPRPSHTILLIRSDAVELEKTRY